MDLFYFNLTLGTRGREMVLVGLKTRSISLYVDNNKSFYSPTLQKKNFFRSPNVLPYKIDTCALTIKLVNTSKLNLINRSLESLSIQYLYAFKSDKKEF